MMVTEQQQITAITAMIKAAVTPVVGKFDFTVKPAGDGFYRVEFSHGERLGTSDLQDVEIKIQEGHYSVEFHQWSDFTIRNGRTFSIIRADIQWLWFELLVYNTGL